jgi:octaprenyl-diphosphate synthase
MNRAAANFGTDPGPLGSSVLNHALHEIHAWTAKEMARCEDELSSLPRGTSVADRGARHLLRLGGKRLRPLCVVLAAKLGRGFGLAACDLAVAAEMIHSATLLHDDVIDLGETRRGAPTARKIFGNAASVLAGDGLLVSALLRILRVGEPILLHHALETLEEMVGAEALQLEQRGRIHADRAEYFRVIEGKTASLFRWALFAGGKIGGLPDTLCRALQGYGRHLGIAFQLVDDLLDVVGDASVTGKDLFADLRDAKVTFPLLLAVEREPALRAVIETSLKRRKRPSDGQITRVRKALDRTGAIHDTLNLARTHSGKAVSCLEGFADGTGRRALVTMAEAVVQGSTIAGGSRVVA